MVRFPVVNPMKPEARITLIEELNEAKVPIDTSTLKEDREHLVPSIQVPAATAPFPFRFLRFGNCIGFSGPGLSTHARVSEFVRTHRRLGNVTTDGSILWLHTQAAFKSFAVILLRYILPAYTTAGKISLTVPIENSSFEDGLATSGKTNK